jgi:small subunit ribosomal protein S6
MSVVNSYEVVMVFSVANGDEATAALVEKFKTMITENATVENVDEWGKRKLAYAINDEPEGYYVLVNFSSTAEFPAELDRVLNITDGVLRSMIIKKDK